MMGNPCTDQVNQRVEAIRSAIRAAEQQAGRSPGEVRLMAIPLNMSYSVPPMPACWAVSMPTGATIKTVGTPISSL